MARETKGTVIKLVEQDKDLLKELVRETVQQILEAEMTDTLGAAKGQRTGARRGYRSGYYERSLVTRVGKMELRVPQDREGHFSTELFERYSRVERAFVGALVEMYVQGVSTRKAVRVKIDVASGHAARSVGSGLSSTVPIGVQFLVERDQRSGARRRARS